MGKITPYIHVPNAKKTIEIYKSVFGASLVSHTPFSPEMGQGMGLPSTFDYENSTMHAVLNINGAEFYISDSMSLVATGPNRVRITIEPDSRVQLDKIWQKVKAAKFKIDTDLQATPWGGVIGIFEDQDGIGWIVTLQEAQGQKPSPSPKKPVKKAGKKSRKP